MKQRSNANDAENETGLQCRPVRVGGLKVNQVSAVLRSLLVFKKLFFQQHVGVSLALERHHSGSWFAAQFAEQVFQCVLEFLGGSIDRQFQAGGFMGNGNRLVAFWPRFQLAA